MTRLQATLRRAKAAKYGPPTVEDMAAALSLFPRYPVGELAVGKQSREASLRKGNKQHRAKTSQEVT
jgi:hypothetical protein